MRRAALLLALLAALAQAPEAWAHASLVKASPADGAVIARPPPSLSLTFNEPVSPLVMRLIGPDGAPISLGSVTAENETVTINVLRTMGRGTHVLSWRVISSDGHPVGSSIIFSIGAPTARPSAASVADPGVRVGLWTAKLVIYVGLFIGVGGAVFAAGFPNPVRGRPHSAPSRCSPASLRAWCRWACKDSMPSTFRCRICRGSRSGKRAWPPPTGVPRSYQSSQ